jgi:hypothetical protein
MVRRVLKILDGGIAKAAADEDPERASAPLALPTEEGTRSRRRGGSRRSGRAALPVDGERYERRLRPVFVRRWRRVRRDHLRLLGLGHADPKVVQSERGS